MPPARRTPNLRPARRLALLGLVAALILAACRPRQTPPPPTLAPTQPPPVTVTLPPSPTAAPPTPTPTPAPTEARFLGSACPFRLPAGLSEGVDIECGYLVVPADRGDPASGTLQLAVAILRHPEGSSHPDPIVYLEGGPGGSALEYLNLIFERRYAPLFEAGRDILLFDQRGVGLSRPALDCPEQDAVFYELLDNEVEGETLSEQEMNQLNLEAMASCAVNLSGKADLAHFSTDASAADVRDLAQALGYEQINLWGVSYGTRLALEVMRDYPEIVRSAVLDSALPPQVNLFEQQPAGLGRSLGLLFAACAADEACNAAYPDLEQVFYDTVRALNAENARFNATDPLSGRAYAVAVSGDNLIDLTFQFLYDTEVIPLLPRLIYDLSQGKTDLLALLVGSLIASQPAVSDGMHYALQCAEEIPFNSPQAMRAAAGRFPELASYFDEAALRLPFDTCREMGVAASADPSVNQAVVSDVPALVLAGEFDPVTPPEFGELAAGDLSNSFFYEFPGAGHGVSLALPCARQMTIAFFKNPQQAPSNACMGALEAISFVTPPPSEITLIPYTNQEMKVQGVAPEGWEQVSSGVFSRQHSSLDVALVLAQSAPLSAEALLKQISGQVGLSAPPEPAGERRANGLTWTLYAFNARGVQVDMALAEKDGVALLVLLQSTADERENLYQKVFLPMVDALKPL